MTRIHSSYFRYFQCVPLNPRKNNVVNSKESDGKIKGLREVFKLGTDKRLWWDWPLLWGCTAKLLKKTNVQGVLAKKKNKNKNNIEQVPYTIQSLFLMVKKFLRKLLPTEKKRLMPKLKVRKKIMVEKIAQLQPHPSLKKIMVRPLQSRHTEIMQWGNRHSSENLGNGGWRGKRVCKPSRDCLCVGHSTVLTERKS